MSKDADRATTALLAPARDHPAWALFGALNALHSQCGNAHLFRALAERRKGAREMQLRFANTSMKLACDRANALGCSEEAMSVFEPELARIRAELDVPHSGNVSPEYIEALRNVLGNGRTWCERARGALRAGGAKGLDAALRPGTAARSVEIGVKVKEADSLFQSLWGCVGDSRFIIDENVARMSELGKWFGRTRDELQAVFEIHGWDATPGATGLDSGALDRVAERAAAKAVEKMSGGIGDHAPGAKGSNSTGDDDQPNAPTIDPERVGEGSKPTPPRPCVVKAGKALEAAYKARDDLIPENGKPPSKEAWEWVRANRYAKNKCPKLDTFRRYVREYFADDEPKSKLPGRRVPLSGSMVKARDRAAS